MAKKTAKRIILTGAQGTGKTTLMNELAKDGTRTISHIRKTAEANGLDILEATEEGQKIYFKTLKKELSSKRSYISDRGLTCVAAYTFNKAVEASVNDKFKQASPKQVATVGVGDPNKRYLDEKYKNNPYYKK